MAGPGGAAKDPHPSLPLPGGGYHGRFAKFLLPSLGGEG